MEPNPFVLNPDGETVLPFDATLAPLRGRLDLERDSHLTLRFRSPRPLRMWIGRHLAVDDTPERDRTHLFRFMDLAVMLPLEKGLHEIRIEAGDRSRPIRFVDEHCEGRNREEILAAVELQVPDTLVFDTKVVSSRRGPAVCLRFERGQFRKDGMTWQDVWMRPIAGFSAFPPRLLDWSEKPPAWEVRLSSSAHPGARHEVAPWEGRPSGDLRAYVPVLPKGVEAKAARATGEEDRPESLPSVTGEVLLEVTDPLGSARVAMPVYESFGRLAPKREWKEVSPPDFETVWAAVPKPVLPERHAGWARMYRASWEMLCRLWRPLPIESGLPNGYLRTAEQGFEHLQFQWDTCFTTLAAAWGARAFPVHASLDCLYARQEDGGHIERECDVRDNRPVVFEPGFGPNPPLIGLAERAIFRLTGDRDRIRSVLPALEAQFTWLLRHRRLDDGTFWTTGLANGLDNNPTLGEGYPCLTAQTAHFAETLAEMHGLLGEAEEARRFTEIRDEIAVALNRHLWSDELGCYSTSLLAGGHNPNKSVTTFWPLWAGVVPPERVKTLVRLARDPACFNRPHPLPSLSADSPQFVPGGNYWLGSVWAPTNQAALQGFWRAGERDLAREFAARHLDKMAEVFDATGGVLWENYSSEGAERGSWSQKNYSWTAASPVALLLEILLGLEPDAAGERLTWRLPEEDGMGVENVPLGKATISVLHERKDGTRVLTVTTDRAFTLAVVADERERDFPIAAGRHELRLGD